MIGWKTGGNHRNPPLQMKRIGEARAETLKVNARVNR